MSFREFNRRKNLWLRAKKAMIGKFLFDKKNTNRFTPSSLKTIRKVLFLRNDNKLGDMVISTISFREIKKQLPQVKVAVISGPQSAKIIENNKNVDEIFILKRGLFCLIKLALKLRKEHFDLYVDFDREPTFATILLLRIISPRFAFGFNRQEFKLYNITTSFEYDSHHMSIWHKEFFKTIHLSPPQMCYDVFIPKTLKNKALDFVNKIRKANANIIVNPFAASNHRCLNYEQIEQIANGLANFNFIVIGQQKNLSQFVGDTTLPPNIFLSPSFELFANLALLFAGDLLLTPDTAFVHASVALDKPQICIYRASDKTNKIIWAPNSPKAIVLDSPDEISLLDPQLIIDNILSWWDMKTGNV